MSAPWSAKPPNPPAVAQAELIVPMPLLSGECVCTWTVHQQGAGMACLMRRRYPNRACAVRHERLRLVAVPATFSGGQ